MPVVIADYADQLARGEELQFRTSRKQMAKWGFLAFVFVIIGLCMIGSDSIGATVAGWLAVIFFGLATVIAIIRSISPTVQLKLSNQGVWTRMSDNWIPWAAIGIVDWATNGNERVLALGIKDEEIDSVGTPEWRAEREAERAAEVAAGEEPSATAVVLPGSLTISADELGHLIASEVSRRAGGNPTL